jgi:hypothetical protein
MLIAEFDRREGWAEEIPGAAPMAPFEQESARRDCHAGEPRQDHGSAPTRQDAGRGPDKVQQDRRKQEADGIGEGVRRGRQLGAVRVTVEDGEQRDCTRDDPCRRPQREGNREAQHDRRQGDSRLDRGHADASRCDGGTTCHRQRKQEEQAPHRAAAEQHRPETDRHHREEMIPAV